MEILTDELFLFHSYNTQILAVLDLELVPECFAVFARNLNRANIKIEGVNIVDNIKEEL